MLTKAEQDIYWFEPAELLKLLQIYKKLQDKSTKPVVFQSFHGISKLPEPFNTANAWVACSYAEPHVDQSWEGQRFVTLGLTGKSLVRVLQGADSVLEYPAGIGYLFTFNPAKLHWMTHTRNSMYPGFVGLQWEVPAENADAFVEDLVARISKVVPMNHRESAKLVKFEDMSLPE
ncbi:hypothetical protein ACYPKM_04325 [Pseudomonas aeruginosa]